MSRVLVFEPHPYHYEVIISSVYYFKELGYDVELLVRDNFNREDLFSRCDFETVDIHYYKNDDEMISFLSSDSMKNFDFIFFNSLEYWRKEKKERVLDFLGFEPKTKYGILGIYHNIEMINAKDDEFLKENRIFALTPISIRDFSIPMFAACYFGTVKENSEFNKSIIYVGLSNDRCLIEKDIAKTNGRIKITVLGRLMPIRDITHKILKKLINAVRVFFRMKVKYNNVGSVLGAFKINYCISPSFERMYNEIEDHSFIGIAIDTCNEQTKSFLNGKTSGSKQLVMGFNKPCIINSELCDSFMLDRRYCITYKDNDLKSAFDKARNISFSEYYEMKKVLKEDSNRAVLETINALRKTIKKCIEEK